MTLLDKAKEYATIYHSQTNHEYDEKPYSYHLQMVVDAAAGFIQLIPEHDRETVLAACWCHDVIEDTRQTYNDVAKATSVEVAEIVYALTNEKGKNRKERANDKYYAGIRAVPYAGFVKACDRLANVLYSRHTTGKMFAAYKREHEQFRKELYCDANKPIFDNIEMILND